MVEVKRKNKIKRPLAITVTASILLVLIIVTTVVLETLINGGFSITQGGTTTKEPLELIEGEAYLNGSTPLMYPGTSSDKIQSFSISGKDVEYFAAKRPGKEYGVFIYYYEDNKGEEQAYFPPICSTEADFDYTTLYAISDDGINTQKLTYVLAALANPMFDDRIKLTPDTNGHYGRDLAIYGLDSDSRKTMTVSYLETKDGKEVETQRTIYIGDKLVTGVGYYVQMSDRPEYVYIASGVDYYKYALEGFSSFIVPRLVMQGNTENGDSTKEPLLTTSYKQWSSVVHDGKDEWGNEIAEFVAKNSNVVFTANKLTPIYPSKDYVNVISDDGYIHYEEETYQVDLSEYANRQNFQNFVTTIEGKEVGSSLLVTIVSNTNSVEITDGKSRKYTYKITAVDSVITPTKEYTSADEYTKDKAEGKVGENSLIKVEYTYLVDGNAPEVEKDGVVYSFEGPFHAVIDLNDFETLIKSTNDTAEKQKLSDAWASLKAASLGVLSSPVSFDLIYTKDNAQNAETVYNIKDITLVYDETENGLVAVNTITENSIVNYTYQLLTVKRDSGGNIISSEIVSEGTETLPLDQITEETDEFYRNIKAALVEFGQVASDVNLAANTQENTYQIFRSFTTYSIKSIDYYVVREMVSAYKFVNPSKRDDFYGEAIHSNDLPADHKYKPYAVDWQSCDYVAKVLGGLTAGSSSTVFEGLWGEKVVAVGLTPDNMKEYGLYAHTIYFEIPRLVGMQGDEFTWLETVGFTLYISDVNENGKRLVGSDMYNIIVEMDGDILYWVDESFEDFWARRDLVMVQQTKLDKVTATLNLKEIYGKYVFEVEHPDAWMTDEGVVVGGDGEGMEENEIYEALHVYASVADAPHSDTLVSEYINSTGAKDVWLADIYDIANGYEGSGHLTKKYDTLGDSNFKSFLSVLYSIGYVGTLTDDDLKALEESGRTPVMTLSFYLESSSTSAVDEYAYDFYYTDDGRVAVSLYRYNASTGEHTGERCNFYISNYSFKTLVGSISDMLNGAEVDLGEGFRDWTEKR